MTAQTTSDLADALAFAQASVRQAGGLLTGSYERVERIDHKSARDVVTEVDFASEKLLLAAIRDRYPDDGILAEESGHHRRPNREPFAGRTWVIDPLDGTVNYANGIPYFSVSMALVDADGPLLGVVLDPQRDDLYAATRGGPATLNGEPIHASDKDQLSDYVVSLAVIGRGGLGRERKIARAIRIHRRMGSAALAFAYVANGRFDAFIQNGGLSLWDVAAAGLIAERAGAAVSDLHGGPWWDPTRRGATISIVAAPLPHHAALLQLLASIGTQVRARRP
jgi:myo-inositol-1(or 4)-monophosphatase